MKLQALLLLAIGSSGVTQAQEVVNSPDYHARHNADSVYYQGGRDSPHPPQPNGWWEKTWGAIAPSTVDAVLGTAQGAQSKNEAERLAIADCEGKGGGGCRVEISYENQCAVMIVSDRTLNAARAASIDEATKLGMERCNGTSRNCRVYYSACTEPIFHKY